MAVIHRHWLFSPQPPRLRRGDPLWSQCIAAPWPYRGAFFDLVSRRAAVWDRGTTPFDPRAIPGGRFVGARAYGDASNAFVYRAFPSIKSGPYTLVVGWAWDGNTEAYQTPLGFFAYSGSNRIGIYVPRGGTAGAQVGVDSTAMGTTNLVGMLADQNELHSYGYSVGGSGQIARGYKDGRYTGDSASSLFYAESDSYRINQAQNNEGAWGWFAYGFIFRRELTDAEHRELAPDRLWRHLEGASIRVALSAPSTSVTVSGASATSPATGVGSIVVTHSVSGAAAADSATGVGSIVVTHLVSGAAAADSATGAGSLSITGVETVSGAVVANQAIGAGSATLTRPLSGAVTADPATGAGSSTLTHTLSGAVVVDPTTTGGVLSALGIEFVSGAVAAGFTTVAGSFTLTHTLSGALAAEAATVTGALSIPAIGLSGSVVAGQAASTSSAMLVHPITGHPDAQTATGSGSAVVARIAYSAAAAQTATGVGAILVRHYLHGVAQARGAVTVGGIRREGDEPLGGILRRKRARAIYAVQVGDRVLYDTSKRRVERRAAALARQLRKETRTAAETLTSSPVVVAIPKARLKQTPTPEGVRVVLNEILEARRQQALEALTTVLLLVD